MVFASQYDQILAHPWSRDLAVSPDALTMYLQMGYILAPRALLSDTYMLEPGTWATFDITGQSRRGTFFAFPRYREPDLRGEAAYEAVDAAVSAAVRRQLVSDVPLGAFLSGGIDSPLVTARMAAEQGSAVQAFTIGTGGDALDESPDAARYAHDLGIQHHIEHVTPTEARELLEDVVAACGEPFADYSIFPTMLVSRLARRHVTVMLSGDGGDELFWGYVGRFGSVIARAPDFRQPRWLRNVRWGARKYLNLGSGHWNLRIPSIGRWYRARHTHLGGVRRLFPDVPDWPADDTLFKYDGSDVDHVAQWLRWNEFVGHLTRVLLKVDRASMYYALEVRVPLLDREVIDVATRIDWRTCLSIAQGIGKIPLRRALARYVPSQTTVKRGFTVPMDAWMRSSLRPVMEETLLNRRTVVGLPFDNQAARVLYNAHLTGRVDHGWGLWILLSLALWEDRHFRSRHAAAIA